MRRRPIVTFRPGLERFEEKKLLSAGSLAAHALRHGAGARGPAFHGANAPGLQGDGNALPADPSAVARPAPPNTALQLFRITTPTLNSARLVGPFQQVFVQNIQPVPGQVYNILSLSVRNGTARTFDASDGFTVKITGNPNKFPILTGSQQWRPGQFIVFYILTKKYYPVSPVLSGGFLFDFGRTSGIAIPGPSGIYQRVVYNPATFPKLLNWIIAFGPGAKGHDLGLPDTAIWEITSARTNIVPL